MSLLVRKIARSKWYNKKQNIDIDTPADAISSCLRTQNNTLSVWRIEDESEVKEAILAIISNQDQLDTIDIVILKETYLSENSIQIETTKGETPVKELVNIHRDLSQLTYSKLGIIAKHITDQEATFKRITVKDSKQIILEAIEKKRLSIDDLKVKVRMKIAA
ncbi:hypothetical protein [Larkinella sp.]|uniref:hypothetical protein n=1 Tax=Larkinella sp. TaxID=2034517 RepID=UPI003BAD71F1